ncbi:MAG: hypothetical protein QW638_03330 [Candidatus Bathyarchaeia archaeon]
MSRRLVFDAGPFILLFTNEKGSDLAREAIKLHERGEFEVFIHPNNLAEAYRVICEMRRKKPELLTRDVEPEMVIRSAYATLKVIQDERTTVNLGILKLKYRDKPWGDLSSAALALRLSDRTRTPVVILDQEEHFEDLKEVEAIKISNLKLK